MNNILLKIHNFLKTEKGSSVILVIHKNPDGDTTGSGLAFFEYLKKLNITPIIYCQTKLPKNLEFLPDSEKITNDKNIFTNKNIKIIITLDCGDLKQTAGIEEILIKNPKFIINIDHHPTNQGHGNIDLINKDSSSTAEIIFEYFIFNKIKITPKMATSILTGIITDTDNFTNSATNINSLKIASKLISLGANHQMINKNILKSKNINILKLWGVALSRLEKHPEMNLAHTHLKQEDFLKLGVDEETADGISNFLNNLEEAKIALILKETKDGKIKGSLRTTDDNIDVSKIAVALGGGGHKKASGFTTEGNTSEVLKKIAKVYKDIENNI